MTGDPQASDAYPLPGGTALPASDHPFGRSGSLPSNESRSAGALAESAGRAGHMKQPPAVPDHILLRPIGRGAYGEVWLGRNVMGVLRAVKVIERRQFDSHRPYEREFAGIQRYEPVSRLTDGLVHVLHVGRNDEEGYFYYVMELADSVVTASGAGFPSPDSMDGAKSFDVHTYEPRTLRSDLKRRPCLPPAECLSVALDVVNGLARLHEQGLVHRDVKPGNIIFVAGRAKLADIGLVSTGSEGRTFVGTEGYIPPEGPGSPAADIYALGMALYEALTGYPPDRFPKAPLAWFADEGSTEAIEFHEIVLKACEGAKERRYQSAKEMQADLALLQSGQSVRRVRLLERRAARTQRLAWAAGIVVTCALAAALVANWRTLVAEQMRQRESALLLEAREARHKEAGARARAEEAERDARRQLNTALSEQAHALVLSKELGHRARALEALRRAAGATNEAELRRIAFAALALPDLQPEREVPLDPTTTLMQPDPRFERIALAQGRGPVTVCSLPNLEVLATLPASTNRPAYSGVWSADGTYLAVKRQHDVPGFRSDWEVWNVAERQRVVTARPDVSHACATFHPTRSWFMAGHHGGRVTEWDLQTGLERRTFHLPGTPHALAYSPDGKRLAACYQSGSQWVAAFHDATTLEVLRSVELPESVESLAWHPHGRWVTCTSAHASTWTRGVRLIDPEAGRVTTLGQHKIKVALSEFNVDGNHLVSSGWDREIICWDLRTLERAFTYAGPAYRYTWSADGRHCALILPDNALQFYTFERPNCRDLPGNPGDSLGEGRFSPDGRWLLAQDEQNLCVWDLNGDAPAVVVPVPYRTAAFFAPDGTEIFAAPNEFSDRGFLGRWRVAPGRDALVPPRLEPLPVEVPRGLRRAGLALNELVMTTGEGVQFVALTNLKSGLGRSVRIPAGYSYVSPDGRWLAMLYDYSPMVGVYRLPAVEEVARLQTSNLVSFVAFSPNADEMLVLNRGGAEWFDTATWRCTRRQPGTPVSGAYAFYTPDGTGIWMVTHFRNAALLDRRTLEPLLPLPNDVLPLAVSPDGRQLAVGVEGRRVQLWDLAALRQELARLGHDW